MRLSNYLISRQKPKEGTSEQNRRKQLEESLSNPNKDFLTSWPMLKSLSSDRFDYILILITKRTTRLFHPVNYI